MSFQMNTSFLWLRKCFSCGLGVEYYKFCINAPLEPLGQSWPYWRPSRGRFIQENTGGSIISSMPIFVLFFSPPKHHESSVFPPVNQPIRAAVNSCPTLYELQYWLFKFIAITISRPHDQFHQTQSTTPFIGGSVAHTVSPTVTKIHTPIDLISLTTFMLTVNLPICSTQQEVGHVGLFGKHIQCNFMYSS